MKVLVVIPAFNEEPTIARVVQGVRQHVRDVMVIDDGSEDATTFVSMMSGGLIHRLKDNTGKGAALKTGFGYALATGYDWVITLDGDGQHDPNDIPNFLSLFTHYDLILGNRMKNAVRLPFLRRIANVVMSLCVSAVCGRRIHDSQTGFRAYSRRALESIDLHSQRYEIETEAVIKASRRGLRIGEAPIRTIYAGEPTCFNRITDSARFVWVLIQSFFWW